MRAKTAHKHYYQNQRCALTLAGIYINRRLRENRQGAYDFSLIVTNSSAAVGWIPIVASN